MFQKDLTDTKCVVKMILETKCIKGLVTYNSTKKVLYLKKLKFI